jgi:hypothetical protein
MRQAVADGLDQMTDALSRAAKHEEIDLDTLRPRSLACRSLCSTAS